MISDVVVRDADAKGKGVFAQRAFQVGEFIFRRRHGRVVAGFSIPPRVGWFGLARPGAHGARRAIAIVRRGWDDIGQCLVVEGI